MAFDASGNLYVSNGAFDRGEISVYAAGKGRLLRRIRNIFSPYAVEVDALGYLYVATDVNGILVYGPDSVRLLHVIRRGVKGAIALDFDSAGNLYVANNSDGTVTVYSPGDRPGYPKLAHTIKNVGHPIALAFAPSGNLVVGSHKSIYVFKSGSLDLVRTITGIRFGRAIAVDSTGMIYVASTPFTHNGYQPGWVSVYRPGDSKPIRRITDGIDVPKSLTLDASDNLYVANAWNSSVTIYSPGGRKRLRTITDGIFGPEFLAIRS